LDKRIGDTFVYIPLFLSRSIPKYFQYFRLIVGVWLLCFHCLEKRDADRMREWVGEVQRIPANRLIRRNASIAEPACPYVLSAIFALEDLPEKWKHYAQINADH
jgi:hypothetical protein